MRMLRFLDLSRHSPTFVEGRRRIGLRLALEPYLAFWNHFKKNYIFNSDHVSNRGFGNNPLLRFFGTACIDLYFYCDASVFNYNLSQTSVTDIQ